MNGCIKCGNTHEWAGYLYGFCDACAKSILTTAAKRYARKANATPTVVNKKLSEDLAACEKAIAALATAVDRLDADDFRCYGVHTAESWRPVIDTATARYTRALTDHRLLWSMYRRADKSTPYYESQPVAEPQRAEPVNVPTRERELVAV
jgi:hypothetical protein